MVESKERATLTWRKIPDLKSSSNGVVSPLRDGVAVLRLAPGSGTRCNFASVSVAERKFEREFSPTAAQLLQHPLAVGALVPRDAALFFAGAIAGAAAKSVTAPLDRIKLLMQVRIRFVFFLLSPFSRISQCLKVRSVQHCAFRRLTACELDKKVPRERLVSLRY